MIQALGVVGTRPNYMKMAPIHRAMVTRGGFEMTLVHSGQHYDVEMSDIFFEDLELKPPDVKLDVGSGTHAQQTAGVMAALEPVLLELLPDVVVIVGDVNSTMAAALTAVKLHIPIAHVEGGLRSNDRTMPEEINRIVADIVSDLVFAPSRDAVENLIREGVEEDRIHLVGNVMIDSMLACLERAKSSRLLEKLDLRAGSYFVATLHRPENVDSAQDLQGAVGLLLDVAQLLPTILVAHPRTSLRLRQFGLDDRLNTGKLEILPALGYLDFLMLMKSATAVLTDSGGIQEETTVLGVPCITLRRTTERPVTVTEGTNTVTGMDRVAVMAAAHRAIAFRTAPRMPELWDGKAAERVVDILIRSFS